MRKSLTPEQIAARDERKAKFRVLWKTVADMPEDERLAKVGGLGFVNVDGRAYSCRNMMLLALQSPNGTVFGGFRQWLAQGRAVRKGEHGAMILVPIAGKTAPAESAPDGEAAADGRSTFFITGTVFDISQTSELEIA